MIKNCFVLCIIAVLTACSSAPEVRVVEKETIRVITTPATLTQKVAPNEPPARAEYVAATWPKKEEYLITYVNSLLGSLAKCNNQLSDIVTLQAKEKTIAESQGTAK